jgi:hypothetical protein
MPRASHLSPQTASAPNELIAVVARGGERTAESTIELLTMLGFPRPGAGEHYRLTAAFLAGLGIALRLHAWEMAGLHVHRDAGLPRARELLDEVIKHTVASKADTGDGFVRSLLPKFLEVTKKRLAWGGKPLLGADVVLGNPDEDALLDALARLCWACREGRSSEQTT